MAMILRVSGPRGVKIRQTLLREVLLVADHNAYHLGQIVMARRTLKKA